MNMSRKLGPKKKLEVSYNISKWTLAFEAKFVLPPLRTNEILSSLFAWELNLAAD